MGALPARMCPCKESNAKAVVVEEEDLNAQILLQEENLVQDLAHEVIIIKDPNQKCEAFGNIRLAATKAAKEVRADDPVVSPKSLPTVLELEVSPDGTPHGNGTEMSPSTAIRDFTPKGSLSKRVTAAFTRTLSGDSPGTRSADTSASRSSKIGRGVRGLSWKVAGSLGMNQMRNSGNSNRPRDYIWLKECLSKLVENSASSVHCSSADLNEGFVPIFFVIGACPNVFCGMQAVMYCRSRSRNKVDFWWVKPTKRRTGTDGGKDVFSALEQETLNRHSSGPHKNDPGRSRQFYQPLADVFENGTSVQGWCFGIEEMSASPDPRTEFRAFLKPEEEPTERFYVHLFWTEDWTSNPLASKKFIRGKIVYQKRAGQLPLFARQYEIVDEVISISDIEEQLNCSELPDDTVKVLWQKSESRRSSNKMTTGFTINPKYAAMFFGKT